MDIPEVSEGNNGVVDADDGGRPPSVGVGVFWFVVLEYLLKDGVDPP